MKYIEEVIQEFEKKFCKSLLGYDLKFLTSEERANINQLKEFIQSALQKQIEMIEGEIEHQKEQLQKETGAFKYDFVYDGVLSILSQYK